VSSDFEELLNRLDSDDLEIRQDALEELATIFRGPHAPRVELRRQIRALLDRWDADDAVVAIDAQSGGREQTRRPRTMKEGRVSPEERESSDAKPDSSEEASPREDPHDSQRAGVAAMDDAQPRGEPPSRRREELGSLHGLWSGRPRPELEFDDDRTFLGEVARPFFERREETLRGAIDPLAVSARVRKQWLWVDLLDGRSLGVPIGWFPRLANGKPKQRRNVVIGEAGRALHWPELDEDLGVERLLTNVPVTMLTPDKGPGGKHTASRSKKGRRSPDRRLARDWGKFAHAEGNGDPIQARRIPDSKSHTPDDRLNEIEERHLGPLPDDLSDRAAELYLDAVDDIALLVSEVWRLRAATGHDPSVDSRPSNPDDRKPGNSLGSTGEVWLEPHGSDQLHEAEPNAYTAEAIRVRFTKRHLWVELAEGGELAVPTHWFPWLVKAKRKRRLNVVLAAGGTWLHWPKLERDLRVGLLVHAFAPANQNTPYGGHLGLSDTGTSKAPARRHRPDHTASHRPRRDRED
jgi:hypothetical protein